MDLIYRLSLTTAILAALVASSHARAENEGGLSCDKVRIALDVGSSSTKMRAAVVDTCLHKILVQVGPSKKVPVSWRDNLEVDSGGKKTIAISYIKTAIPQLTDAIQQMQITTTKLLQTDSKYAAYAALAKADNSYDYVGGATAAVRDSNPASKSAFIAAVKTSHAHIRILSQIEEGHLGFNGVFGLLGNNDHFDANPSHMLSWDIGSTSMQMEGYFTDKSSSRTWHDFGNLLTSNSFTPLFVKSINDAAHKSLNSKSPNPILDGNENDDLVFQKAGEIVSTDPQVKALISSQRSNWVASQAGSSGVTVYGIGGSHNGALAVLHLFPGKEKATGYTQNDLKDLLRDLLHLSDEDLGTKYKVDKKFTSTTVTNILLIYTMMNVVGIQRVEVVDVDNALGILPTPVYWDDPSSGENGPPTP